MAGDVSCLVRVMNGGDNLESTAPITRDLLGGRTCSKELDLDLQVPSGWEKRLDLQSGKVYLKRCNSSSSSNSNSNSNSNSSTSEATKSPNSKLQDLNFIPPSPKQTLNLFEPASLDLNLVSSNYQSVCTLDKVKSALQRADKENTRKRSASSVTNKSSSSPRSTSSSSVVEFGGDQEKSSTASIAAGCPSCLLYVLISRCNPKCPRCYNEVPLPVALTPKKPRIDLNISI